MELILQTINTRTDLTLFIDFTSLVFPFVGLSFIAVTGRLIMNITLITKPGNQSTGVGRYTFELKRGLLAQGHEVNIITPIVPLPGWFLKCAYNLLGWDLYAFFNNYPVWAHYPKGSDIYHLVSQNLASLLIFCPPPGKTVVTVHDIIPRLGKNNKDIFVNKNIFQSLFDGLSMIGLKRAVKLIAVSDYTRKTIIDSLGVTPQKIQVVHEGVLS